MCECSLVLCLDRRCLSDHHAFCGPQVCLAVAASLDARGVRERALQAAIRAYVQFTSMRRRVAEADAAEDAAAAASAEQEVEAEDSNDDDYTDV